MNKDIKEQTLERTDFGGGLNAGLHMAPIEKAFDRLVGTKNTGIKVIAARMPWRISLLKLDRRKRMKALLIQSILPLGLRIGFIAQKGKPAHPISCSICLATGKSWQDASLAKMSLGSVLSTQKNFSTPSPVCPFGFDISSFSSTIDSHVK